MSPDEAYRVYCDLAWADLSGRIRDMRKHRLSLEEALWAFRPPSIPMGFEGALADMNLWLRALLEQHELEQLSVELPEPLLRPRPQAAEPSMFADVSATPAPIDRWF